MPSTTDLIKISEEMKEKIEELELHKKSLPCLADEKAKEESLYEKEIAITIASLINGKEFELEGRTIKNPPNAVLDKLAKGLCWKQKFSMDTSDLKYRNSLKIIDITESQLNGYQSINRYLSET